MRLALVPLAASLLWGMTACGGDVCEQAYEKQQDCAEALNCSTMDPTTRTLCDAARQRYTVSYTLYKANQEDNQRDMTCEGDLRTRAEGIMACTLAPQSLCEMCQ